MAITWKKLAFDADVISNILLTTRGDIIRRGAAAPERLAKGTEGHVLTMGASDPEWAAAGGGVSTFVALTDTPADFTGSADKCLVGNEGENALVFADPIPKATDWKGSFNWDTSVYTTAEQDISALFSTNLAIATRRKYSVKLDLTAVEADGSFDELYLAVKEKIDGTNYRAIDRKTVTKANLATTAEPGIIIDIPATSENIQITMQMKTALAGDAAIYYAVVMEALE